MKIPSDRKYTQLNEGDTFGVLRDSRNMNFDILAKARLSRKVISVFDSNNDADFGFPIAINYFSGNYVVLTDDEIFEVGLTGGGGSQVAGAPTVGLNSDALIFNSFYYVTLDDNLSRWNGNATWNNSLASLTAGVPHPMAIFDSQTTYKLAIGNGNLLHTYDTSHNLNTVILTLPSQFEITTIRYRNGYMYVGTRNKNGGEARVFIWNGSGVNAQYECPVGAEWIFSMTEYDTSVAIVTSQGYLLQVTGSTYKELASFPIASYPDLRWQGSGGLQYNGKVFNRGMVTVAKNIYINIEGDTDTGFVPEMKSGVWVFNPNIGLTHRASSTTDATYSDASLSVTASVITTSVPHNLKTGDAITFSNISGLTGVNNTYIYYVTVLSATTLKLSLTRKGVKNEKYVVIGGTAGASDVLEIAYNTEYGVVFDTTSGAIARTVYNETPLDNWTSEIIWGCRTKNKMQETTYVLNTFNNAYNVGSFTLQRIYSENIEQTWQDVYAFIDGLDLEDEEIIFKAQTRYEETPLLLQGIWLNENTINSSSVNEFSAWSDLEEGDELVLVDGYGQGYSCHIAEGGISMSGSTASITVDESIGLAGEDIDLYRTTFKKLASRTQEERDGAQYVSAPTLENEAHSAWISLRFELRGFDISVNVMDLLNAVHSTGIGVSSIINE